MISEVIHCTIGWKLRRKICLKVKNCFVLRFKQKPAISFLKGEKTSIFCPKYVMWKKCNFFAKIPQSWKFPRQEIRCFHLNRLVACFAFSATNDLHSDTAMGRWTLWLYLERLSRGVKKRIWEWALHCLYLALNFQMKTPRYSWEKEMMLDGGWCENFQCFCSISCIKSVATCCRAIALWIW